MADSPEEKEALEKLDEETRDVAWDEYGKEAVRERRLFWGLGWFGGLFGFRPGKLDPPPGASGLRDVLDDDQKT